MTFYLKIIFFLNPLLGLVLRIRFWFQFTRRLRQVREKIHRPNNTVTFIGIKLRGSFQRRQKTETKQ